MINADILLVNPVQIYIRCPLCGKVHMHGTANDGIGKNDYSSRVPHCITATGEQYRLVATENTVREETQRTKLEKQLQREMRR